MANLPHLLFPRPTTISRSNLPPGFGKSLHTNRQQQFDTLAYNEAIMDTMTDAEFAIIKARLERVIAAMEAQQSLF